jgi:hypothetical protein
MNIIALLSIPLLTCAVLTSAAGVARAQDFAITKEEIKVGKQEYSPSLHQFGIRLDANNC